MPKFNPLNAPFLRRPLNTIPGAHVPTALCSNDRPYTRRRVPGATLSRDGTALPGSCRSLRVRPKRFQQRREPSAAFRNLIVLGLSPAGRVVFSF